MEVKATLLPGQNGTKQLLQQYDKQLVCVRYRYDKAQQKRVKTIELVIEQTPWVTSSKPGIRIQRPKRIRVSDVLVHIHYNELDLRTKVKNAGGLWLKDKKAWMLKHEQVKALGLNDRIIEFIEEDDLGF